jgi:hypothetical protein
VLTRMRKNLPPSARVEAVRRLGWRLGPGIEACRAIEERPDPEPTQVPEGGDQIRKFLEVWQQKYRESEECYMAERDEAFRSDDEAGCAEVQPTSERTAELGKRTKMIEQRLPIITARLGILWGEVTGSSRPVPSEVRLTSTGTEMTAEEHNRRDPPAVCGRTPAVDGGAHGRRGGPLEAGEGSPGSSGGNGASGFVLHAEGVETLECTRSRGEQRSARALQPDVIVGWPDWNKVQPFVTSGWAVSGQTPPGATAATKWHLRMNRKGSPPMYLNVELDPMRQRSTITHEAAVRTGMRHEPSYVLSARAEDGEVRNLVAIGADAMVRADRRRTSRSCG